MKQLKTKAVCIAAALLTAASGLGAMPAAAAEKAELQRGDVNNDSIVSVEDAQLTLQEYCMLMIGKKTGMTEAQLNAADVNKDAVLDVADAQTILQYYCSTGLVNTEKTWAAFFSNPHSGMKAPDTGDKLTIVGWEELYSASSMIQAFLDKYPKFQGLIEYKSLGSLVDTGNEEQLEAYLKEGGDADLCLVPAGKLSKFINDKDTSVPLSDLGLKSADYEQLYTCVLSEGQNQNDKQMAVSWYTEPGCYVYRSDLAELYLGVKTPEEMQALVKDWDTFTKTAAKLSKASDLKGKMTAWIGDFEKVFPSLRKVPWLDEDNMLQIGQQEKDFVDLLRTFCQKGYMTMHAERFDSDDWYNDSWTELFQADAENADSRKIAHALGTFMSAWELEEDGTLGAIEFANDKHDKRDCYGKFSVTAGPAAWTAPGSYFLFVPKSVNNGSLARDFLDEFIFDADSAAAYAQKEKIFSANSAVNQKIEKSGYKNPLLGGQSQYGILDQVAAATAKPYANTQLEYELNAGFWLLAADYAEREDTTYDMLLTQLDNACCDYPQIKHRTKTEN